MDKIMKAAFLKLEGLRTVSQAPGIESIEALLTDAQDVIIHLCIFVLP
jgi:hypothetical protein